MDNCRVCGYQIHFLEGVWQDNSGGDVCGVDGTNSPHLAYSDAPENSRGESVFTCEFCGDGLATNEVKISDTESEWWCPDCDEEFSKKDVRHA